jgi:hypothetical protein
MIFTAAANNHLGRGTILEDNTSLLPWKRHPPPPLLSYENRAKLRKTEKIRL